MCERMNDKNNGAYVDFSRLFAEFIPRLWIILLTVIVFVAAAYGYEQYMKQPLYSSTATIYIGSKDNDNSVNMGEVSLATYLTKDYEELITRRIVLDGVISQLGLSTTPAALKGQVSVSNPANTRMLDIKVIDSDPVRAKNIADSICAIGSQKIVELMGVDQVNLVDSGSLSYSPIKSDSTSNLFLAGLVGFFVSVAIIAIVIITDDKIKVPDDVERYLGLPVLGATPFVEKINTKKGYAAQSHKSSGSRSARSAGK